jgi:hypothetical protein
MYDIIKKACDVEVGVQSIFVNSGTFGAKSHNKPSQAAAMVVGSICRKLRLRNPPMLPKRATPTSSHHLVVGIHAKSFNVQTPCVLEDGSQGPGNPELVLVALVSRALGSSEDYYTDVKLCNKSEYEKQDVTQLFRTFFSCIRNSPHALTVLRSGHLVDDSVKLQDSRLLKERNDIADFCDVAGKAFTYATLSEDKLLKIRLNDRNDASEDNKHRDLLIIQSNVGEDKSQSCFRVFHEQQAPDGTTGIKVTLHPHASTSSTRPAQSLTPQQSSLTRKVSGIVPLPMQELGSPNLAPLPIAQPKFAERQASQQVPDDVTAKCIEILAHVWKDDHLELYDTKWPIPTYLAQLALDRAHRHLVTNDWVNTKGDQTAPVYLPEVHRNVRDTLYYI